MIEIASARCWSRGKLLVRGKSMKRLAALTVIGAIALGFASAADAQSGYYIGAGAGLTIMKDPTTSVTFPSVRCIDCNITLPTSVGGPTALCKIGGAGDPSFKAKMNL